MEEAPPRPFPPPGQLDHEDLGALVDYYRFLIFYFSAIDPKKNRRPDGDSLLAQDDFRHTVLPNRIAQRRETTAPTRFNVQPGTEHEKLFSTHGWINLEELEQLVEWKL